MYDDFNVKISQLIKQLTIFLIYDIIKCKEKED